MASFNLVWTLLEFVPIWFENVTVNHKKWYTFYSLKICKMFNMMGNNAARGLNILLLLMVFTLVTNHQSRLPSWSIEIKYYQIISFRYRNETVPRLHTKWLYTKLFPLGTEIKQCLVYIILSLNQAANLS